MKLIMGKNVLFAEGHGEPGRVKKTVLNSLIKRMGGNLDFFGILKNYLLRFGYSIQYSGNKRFSVQFLRTYDILVVCNPTRPLGANEIIAIEKFVQLGGSLLLIGLASLPILSFTASETPYIITRVADSVSGIGNGASKFFEYINNISRKFGIFFISTLLKGGKNSYIPKSPSIKTDKLSTFRVPVISHFEPNPIFRKIQNFYHYGCYLEITKEAHPLAYSDGDTIPPKSIVMAISQLNEGRVFATGSPIIFSQIGINDLSIRNRQHAQLALNIFTWLAHKGQIKAADIKVMPSSKVCPFCQYKNPSEEIFCSNCGASI